MDCFYPNKKLQITLDICDFLSIIKNSFRKTIQFHKLKTVEAEITVKNALTESGKG